ncbi:hypothetical protein NDU88_003496 [Pleurodeles waltl]|uniref:Uncharacterized protein n=1 Tax=Pleurodeles waltl TaxID=8319 RepID=A0AAV7T5R2_PLEWA|nr:hypothetical protein NDU88_003496 [Pleurodeles waltl]
MLMRAVIYFYHPIEIVHSSFIVRFVRFNQRFQLLEADAIYGMAGYDDPAEELYYMDDTAGSFDQDLVYALDADVRHSVNQALVQAIQPFKHHLLGLVEQQEMMRSNADCRDLVLRPVKSDVSNTLPACTAPPSRARVSPSPPLLLLEIEALRDPIR